MATQVMTMDSNNNSNSTNSTESVASKLAEVSLAGPDSNNNSNKGVESGDAGKVWRSFLKANIL